MELTTKQKWIAALIINVVLLIIYFILYQIGQVNRAPNIGAYDVVLIMIVACWQFAINIISIITYFILKARNENGKVGLAYLLGIGIVGLIGFSFCSSM